MKAIETYTGVIKNDGTRADAGEILHVGPDADIDADRAAELIANGGAVEAAEAPEFATDAPAKAKTKA